MDSSSKEKEVGYCRDTLMALLDFLVDPLLPSRSTLRDSITLSQQESVAKQVHAVVLLYNYYHRKQHPGLAFLEFRSFCELAVDLKPSLHLYFRVAQKTNYSEPEEIDKDLSLTEKTIMSACVTSKSLDASKNNPIIDGWPITKVAVFLVDSCKENCILFHSFITQGVWSVIEKDINDTKQWSEDLMETRSANKKSQVMKKMDATSLQQLAYLAVKETCGIGQADLKILDSHSVYSTSKPKTTVQLYIMQCTQTNLNMDLVPINEVMDSKIILGETKSYVPLLPSLVAKTYFVSGLSEIGVLRSLRGLQGSLVHRESVTPVVEYFHLLPFADEVLDWLKSGREKSMNFSQDFEATKENGSCNSSLSSMEQPQDPSYHLEDVKNTCGSYLKKELLPSISEQNCTNIHDSGELSLKISRFCEATEEVINSNICPLKEESVEVTPKNCDVSEARNCNNDHLKEESVAVTPKICESTRATNGNNLSLKESPKLYETPEVRNGDSKHLEGESYPHASQPFDDQTEFKNARSACLDEESHPYNSLHPESGLQNLSIYRRKEHPTELVVYKKRNRSQKNNTTNQISCTMTSNALASYPRQEAEQCEATGSSNFMGIMRKKSIDTCEDVHDQKLVLSVQQTDEAALTGQAIVAAEFCDIEKDSSSYQITDTAMSKESEEQDAALVTFGSDFEHLCNSQLTITSKDPSAKTVLNVLLRKREQLSQQLRNIADEIASCEGNIQTILRGGEDQLALKLKTLVDGCNDISQHTAGGVVENTTLFYNNHDLSPVPKRKRLSEAILGLLSPCQELDAICSKNFWMLPSYILSPLEGGFQATVSVKGVDFDCSSEGTTCKTPQEARNSAASIILVKLQSLAAKT